MEDGGRECSYLFSFRKFPVAAGWKAEGQQECGPGRPRGLLSGDRRQLMVVSFELDGRWPEVGEMLKGEPTCVRERKNSQGSTWF